MEINKKNIIWAIIIVLMIVVLGYWQATKSVRPDVYNVPVKTDNNPVTYVNEAGGYSFQYGPEFQVFKKDETGIILSTSNGTLSVVVSDKKFDPKAYEGANYEKGPMISIGGKEAYTYTRATAECAANFKFVPLGSKTLSIIFGACIKESGPFEKSILNDVKAQESILSTFKFTSKIEVKAETNQEILSNLVKNWKTVAPKIIPNYPNPTTAFYGYPYSIQFIGENRLIVAYQDDYNPLYAVLSFDSSTKKFTYLDGLRASPFKISEALWVTWRTKYGDTTYSSETYKFSSTRTGETVYPSDWKIITQNPYFTQ